jgi:hypothetical protein
MPDDSRYEEALAAAFAILLKLTSKPDMPGHERLACVTFSILQAMNRVEEQRPGRRLPYRPIGEARMFMPNQTALPEIHEAAIRIARRCRHIIQACLREEEWGDADREFYLIASEELEALYQSR